VTPENVRDIQRRLSVAPLSRLPRVIAEYESDERAGVAQAIATARARLARAKMERDRVARLYRLENDLRRNGLMVIAGVDEVGRGALAGPVTAAAVVLPSTPRVPGLDDSKRLLPDRRVEVAEEVHSIAVCSSIAHVHPAEIDAIGISAAVKRAMTLALGALSLIPDHVVVDGLPVGVAEGETAVVKGDSKVAAIAAASVIAKVARDTLMVSLAGEYPQYSFDINKGYGTSDHLAAITEYGLSPLHRRSFSTAGGTISLF